MDIGILDSLIKELRKLQQVLSASARKEQQIIKACLNVEKIASPFDEFVDLLRRCEADYGCYSDYSKRAIEWASESLRTGLKKNGSPYPSIWYSLADEKFKAELKRWNASHLDVSKTDSEVKPPLGKIAGLIYEQLRSLPEHKAMTSPEIADWLNEKCEINLDESTIRTNHLTQLEPYGLFHQRRISYCIRNKQLL